MIIFIGGTGFIGKHILCALEKLGSPSITYSKKPNFDFIETYAPSSKGRYINDLMLDESKNDLINADAVVYLASNSIPASNKNSLELEIENNLKPSINCLEYITSINPAVRIIYLSSGGTVYGPGHNKPISEDCNVNPITPYAFGKIAVENYLQFLSNTSDATYTILRPSNPVGRWHMNMKQGFIGASIMNAKSRQPIKIFGNGETIRDYLDADELANAITLILSKRKESKNKTWNIGSGVGTSLNQIIDSLQQHIDYQLTIEYLDSRDTDLRYNVLDCSKIKSELGWSTQLTIDQIINQAWLQLTS